MVGLLAALGLFTLLPMLIGMAYNKIAAALYPQDVDQGMLVAYIRGYTVLLAAFWCYWIVVRKVFAADLLGRPVLLWGAALAVAAVVSIVILNKTIMSIIASIRESAEAVKCMSRQILTEKCAVLAVCVILTILSVACIVPSSHDITLELGYEALHTNGLSVDKTSVIELFYLFPAMLLHAGYTQEVHFIIPLALLPLFYCIYIWIAQMLFHGEKEDQKMFLLFTAIFYVCMSFAGTYTDMDMGFNPLQNIWNGLTLAMTCLLPLEVMHLAGLLKFSHAWKNRGKGNVRCYIGGIAVALTDIFTTAMAVQLCMAWGMGLSVIMIATAVVLIIGDMLHGYIVSR